MIGKAARDLIRRARSAALATSLQDDDEADNPPRPYASLVTIACDSDASPILLLSDLADHTRNLATDNRAALLIEVASGRANPQTGPRVSLIGHIVKSADERHRRRFLARHPSAALYVDFADFNIYRMVVERAHFVGGFGRAMWLAAADVTLDADAAAAITRAEPAVLADLQGPRADEVESAVRRLLTRPGEGWRMIAIDPEGCDVRRRGIVSRLDFPSLAHDDKELARLIDRLLAPSNNGDASATAGSSR